MVDQIFSTGDWKKDEAILRDNNVPENEILAEKQKQYNYLLSNGLDEKEAQAHFGIKEADMSDVKKIIDDNLKKYEYKEGDDPIKKIWAGMGAGFENSTGAMMYRAVHGDKVITPDMLDPSHGDMFYRAGETVAGLAGDLPTMIVGTALGKTAGGALGMGVGTGISGPAGTLPGFAIGQEVGGFAGAFALPAAIRGALIDKYKNGQFKNFGDFWERTSGVFVDTAKSAAVGVATYGAGEVVGAGAKMAGASNSAATTAKLSSELATMVTVGSYINNHVPTWDDFALGAIGLGAIHGVSTVLNVATQNKLADIYARTGKTPEEVIKDAGVNPELKQQLLDNTTEIPEFYLEFKGEPEVKKAEQFTPNAPAVVEGKPIDEAIPQNGLRDVTPPNEVSTEVKPAEPKTDSQKIEDEILSSVGFKDEVGGYNYKDSPYYSARAEFQNQNLVIKAAQEAINGKTPIDKNNAFSVISLFDSWRNRAETFFQDSTRDYNTGKKTGESYQKIVDSVKQSGGDMRGFAAYRISLRDLEIAKQGKKTPRDLTKAQQYVTENASKYESINRRVQDWKNRVIDYGVSGGIINADHAEFLKNEHSNHVSFAPIIEPNEENFFGGSKTSVLKKQKGYDTKNLIQNPFTSDIESAESIIKAVQKNEASRAVVEMLSKEPEFSGIKQIEAPKGDTKALEVWADNNDITLTKQDYKNLNDMNYSAKSLNPDEISYKENGQRKVFKVDPLIAKVVNDLGSPNQVSIFMKVAKGIAQSSRFGITETDAGFGINNTIKDTWASLIKGKVKNPADVINHVSQIMSTIPSILKRDAKYWDYIYNGGSSGNLVNSRSMVTDAFKMEMQNSTEVGVKNKAYNLISDVKSFAAAAWDIFDMPVRMAEYNRRIGAGENQISASLGSKNVSVDFGQKGYNEFNQKWSAVTAFRSAAINGIANFADTVKEDPKGIAIRGTALITTPAIALWMRNKDDERWRRLPVWEKMMYLHYSSDDWQIPTKEDAPLVEAYKQYNSKLLKYDENGAPLINKGIMHRIKLPEIYGTIFAALPVMMLDKAFVDDPVSTNKILSDMAATFVAPQVPNIAAPVIEQMSNTSLFLNSKLVRSQAESALPEVKYNNYTSEVAKALSCFVSPVPSVEHPFSEEDTKYLNSIERATLPAVEGATNKAADLVKQSINFKILGVGQEITAPAIIDNYVRQWTGGLGNYVLSIADKGLSAANLTKIKEKAAPEYSDIPIIKAFVSRQFSGGGVYINQFDSEYKDSKQISASLDVLRSNMEFDKFITLQARTMDKAIKLDGINQTMTGLKGLVQMINLQENMTPIEKRQLMESYYYQLDQIAKQGLLINRQISQDIENSKKGK